MAGLPRLVLLFDEEVRAPVLRVVVHGLRGFGLLLIKVLEGDAHFFLYMRNHITVSIVDVVEVITKDRGKGLRHDGGYLLKD